MKLIIMVIMIIAVFALSIALGAANEQVVEFNYLIAKSEFKLSALLAILFGSGFIIGWLLTVFFYLKIKLKLSSNKRKLDKLQSKYDELIMNDKKNELTKIN